MSVMTESTTTIVIPARELMVAAMFADDSSSRFALQSVLIDKNALVASDGRIMFVIPTDDVELPTDDHQLLLSADSIKQACKQFTRKAIQSGLARVKLVYDHENPYFDTKLIVADVELKNVLVNGRFPNWGDVARLREKDAATFNFQQSTLDWRYLARCQEAYALLCDCKKNDPPPVYILPHGDGPVRVTCAKSPAYAILMPMATR